LHRSNTQQSGKYFQIQLQLTCFVLFYFIYWNFLDAAGGLPDPL
jgi:hypothetical protein